MTPVLKFTWIEATDPDRFEIGINGENVANPAGDQREILLPVSGSLPRTVTIIAKRGAQVSAVASFIVTEEIIPPQTPENFLGVFDHWE